MRHIISLTVLFVSNVAAFAQGSVIFENSLGSGNIEYSPAQGPLDPGNYTVALLFSPSTSGNVPQSSLVQIAVYVPTSVDPDNCPGYFFDPNTIVTPSGSGSATFEVVGWIGGNYSTYDSAIIGGAITGQSPEFVNNMGSDPNHPPETTAPVPISGNGGAWDGNLSIVPVVPEPSTIALGGFGAAALLLFRRRR